MNVKRLAEILFEGSAASPAMVIELDTGHRGARRS
jgi:hypothetical protein